MEALIKIFKELKFYIKYLESKDNTQDLTIILNDFMAEIQSELNKSGNVHETKHSEEALSIIYNIIGKYVKKLEDLNLNTHHDTILNAIKFLKANILSLDPDYQDNPEKGQLAIALLEEAANNNDPGAQTELASYMKNEDPMRQKYLEAAFQQGYIPGIRALGFYYKFSENSNDDRFKKAYECFKLAAEQGDTISMIQLGHFHREGLHQGKESLKDWKQAIECYQAAIKMDNSLNSIANRHITDILKKLFNRSLTQQTESNILLPLQARLKEDIDKYSEPPLNISCEDLLFFNTIALEYSDLSPKANLQRALLFSHRCEKHPTNLFSAMECYKSITESKDREALGDSISVDLSALPKLENAFKNVCSFLEENFNINQTTYIPLAKLICNYAFDNKIRVKNDLMSLHGRITYYLDDSSDTENDETGFELEKLPHLLK